MERKEVTTCRVEEYVSPANRINNDRRIIQHDVVDADLTMKRIRHEMHMAGTSSAPINWQAYEQASRTMARAHRHQPGERGSSTIHKNSIVRRGPE